MMNFAYPRSLALCLLLLCLSAMAACVNSDNDSCTRNSDCSDPNAQCVDGACTVECVEDRDCQEGFTCQQGACTEEVRTCRTDDDCVFGEECQNGECVKVEGYCERNGDCPDGYVCRGETSTCIPLDGNNDPECALNSDCASDEVCQSGECVDAPVEEPDCVRDSDCPTGMRCASGACIDECAEDRDCEDGEVCDGGQCVQDSSSDDCRVDADLCSVSQECCEGVCVARGQCGGAQTCTQDPSLCQPSEECCEGACVPRGQCGGAGDYWAVCTARAQCSSELCLGDPQTGQGHCTERCNFRQDCPASPTSLCIQSYHSLAQQAPELSGICFADDTGTPCQSASSCFDSLCLVRQDPNGGVDQSCSIRCQTSSDCLPGHACGPVSFDTGSGQPTPINVCIPLGSACGGAQGADQCFAGICVTDENPNLGYCTSWCVENGNCPAGWECTQVAQDASVCTPQ